MINTIKDKSILFVVSHYDDECLFAGGLLSELKGSDITVAVMTEPSPGRPDTDTRKPAFDKVCKQLSIKSIRAGFTDPRTNGTVATDMNGMDSFINHIINKYDVVITHNLEGEYGHYCHKLVSYLCAKNRKDLYMFGVGVNHNITVDYDVNKKKDLIKNYLPWEPLSNGYSWVYEPEKFMMVNIEI